MDKIINKFLLKGDKFMPKLHLNQPGFTYSAKHLSRNGSDEACVSHDSAYSDTKVAKRTISDKF